MSKPYKDIDVVDDVVVRTFDENIDPVELMWHRDEEDRLVESINPTNWMVQIDDNLPVSLDKQIFIPKGVYHRVIKGDGDLTIKIKKCQYLNY